MDVLTVEQLYLRRGNFMVCDVNFSVQGGQMLAVCGRSGAGKSTLIYGIGGALRAEAGKICYWGKQMYENEKDIRQSMSVVYDAPNFNTELKPERLVREIMKFEPSFDRAAFEAYMEQLKLDAHKRVRLYSADMQKELMLVLALCRNPGLLVMDEPTSGLDQESKELMWEMIGQYRRTHEAAVVYTTHHREEAKRAQKVLFMRDGACRETEDTDGSKEQEI